MGWGTRKIGSSALTSTKKLGVCAQSTCACGQIPPYCSWEREIASTQSRCGYVVRGVSTKLKFDDVGCLWNADCELACGTSIYSVKDIAAQHLSTNSTCLPATFFLGETGLCLKMPSKFTATRGLTRRGVTVRGKSICCVNIVGTGTRCLRGMLDSQAIQFHAILHLCGIRLPAAFFCEEKGDLSVKMTSKS
jgi:hypothetical protein